jgi:hypothetical protein
MELDVFKTHMQRITDTFGSNFYPKERIETFWKCFKSYPNHYMEQAVNWFVLRARKPPLFEEFEKQFRFYELRKNQDRSVNEEADPVAAFDKLCGMTNADPDFVRACRKTLKDKLQGKITRAEFLKKCDQLEDLGCEIMRNKVQHSQGVHDVRVNQKHIARNSKTDQPNT